jgi:hypothetical protein
MVAEEFQDERFFESEDQAWQEESNLKVVSVSIFPNLL